MWILQNLQRKGVALLFFFCCTYSTFSLESSAFPTSRDSYKFLILYAWYSLCGWSIIVDQRKVNWTSCCNANCNIFSVLSILKCNPGKTNIISLLLFNHFYPVISHRRVQKEKKATNCIRLGRSLWSAS